MSILNAVCKVETHIVEMKTLNNDQSMSILDTSYWLSIVRECQNFWSSNYFWMLGPAPNLSFSVVKIEGDNIVSQRGVWRVVARGKKDVVADGLTRRNPKINVADGCTFSVQHVGLSYTATWTLVGAVPASHGDTQDGRPRGTARKSGSRHLPVPHVTSPNTICLPFK